MPSSLSPPSLLSVARTLLVLRLHLTRRTIERSPAAQTASVLGLVLVCPAAWQIGGRAARLLTTTPAEAFPAVCAALLLITILYVALLLAGQGGVGGVMEPPPATVLCALPVPPGATLLADAVSFAVSLPTLFFVIAAVPLATRSWQSAVPVVLLGLFALCLALLFGRLGALVAKRGRTGLITATGALLFLVGCVLRAAPAAALSSVVGETKPSVRLPWDPPPPPPPAVPAFLAATAPGLAARCLTAPGGGKTVPLLALAVTVALTAVGTVLIDRVSERTEGTSDAVQQNRALRTAPRHAGPFVTEARLLLRDPSAHTALRGPASLLLAIAYAWIAPNLGPDAVRNLSDLLGMGLTLYILAWQTQFVCNRFGSEAGCAATLFSLPRDRWRILFTKNLVLFASLFVFDGVVLSGFALVAGNPRFIPTLLVGLVPVLILFTALGNLASVGAVFPIARKKERFEREPERVLLFLYIAIFIGTCLLFLPVLTLGTAWGIAGYALGVVYVAALYAASVWITARRLTPAHEQKLISQLDGVK
ncbi:MAG: hypothetical protein H7145_21915 [Akkermansiaceae bacterium]|nr:hypothetical protein [Armatimonadota bacterium]